MYSVPNCVTARHNKGAGVSPACISCALLEVFAVLFHVIFVTSTEIFANLGHTQGIMKRREHQQMS